MSSDKRIDWIDTARGLGLLCVFVGHLNVPYASAWVYLFHMPLFFFLSGLLYPGCKKYSFSSFAWRRFKSLVIPYFTLGSVIFLFYCIVYSYYREPSSVYLEMLHEFLVQEHYWTIWFLAALFLTQLIYYGIDYCFSRWKYAVTIASVALCAFGLMRYRLGWGSLPWNLDVAFEAQFFFHLGYRFMHSTRVKEFFVGNHSIYKFAAIILVCLAVNVIAAKACIVLSGYSLDMSIGQYGNEIMTFIAAVAGILMIVTLASVIHSDFLSYIGRNTMILFSWHSRIVIVACGMIYAHFGLFQTHDIGTSVLRASITLIIILVVLIPVNELIKRLPCHKIFGV